MRVLSLTNLKIDGFKFFFYNRDVGYANVRRGNGIY